MKKIFVSLVLLVGLICSSQSFAQTVPAFSEQCTLSDTNTSCNLRNEEGQGIGAHVINVTINGTNSGSSVLLQWSDTSQTAGFSTLITLASTSSGESSVTTGTHKFWKFTLSAFTPTSVPASVTAVHKGYNFTPGTASIGSVTIDQSTPGTTNGVSVVNVPHVVVDSGGGGGTQYTQDVALTIATSVGTMAMGRASAAAPTDVSAVNDAVMPWYLLSGAQAVQLTNAGVLTLSGSGTAPGALRVELPTNGTGVIATVGAVTAITNALPSGTNAIGKLAANSGVDIGDVDVTSLPALAAGSNIIGNVRIDQTTPGTTNGVVLGAETTKVIGTVRNKYADGTDMLSTDVVPVSLSPATSGGLANYTVTAAASDNHVVIKAGAGQVFNIIATSIHTAAQYIRLYNATTGFNGCNSATNLVWKGIVPGAATGAGYVIPITNGIAFSTGISICITGAIGDTDTTSATAAVLQVNVGYK